MNTKHIAGINFGKLLEFARVSSTSLLLLTYSVIGIPKEELGTNDSALIYWSRPEAVSSYDLMYFLYMRPYNKASDTTWRLLKTVNDTQITIRSRETGMGSFVLGVTSKHDNLESTMHTSLDSTAIPPCGWYLTWENGTLVEHKYYLSQPKIKPVTEAYLLNGRKASGSNRQWSTGYTVQVEVISRKARGNISIQRNKR